MYAGLVATELSAKLGRAWRNAPQELRDRYDALAEEAKKEHAATYPDYKFTPVKRGTGKRALKLAAQAADAEMAEMDAATLLMSMAFHSAPLINGNDGPPASTTAGRSTPPSVAAIGRPKGPQRIKVRKPNTARAIAVTKLPVLAPASNRPVSNASSTGSTRLNRNVARAIPIPGIHMDVSPAPAPLSATTASASVTTAPAPGSPPETATTETAVTDSEQDSQPRRPQPQLSPAMFVFRESIARRSPDTSSSLVAPIVMNAWLKVSQGVRDYYENRAETDPRFQGKNKTIPLIRCENKRPNKRRLAAAVAAAAAAASEAAAEPAGPSATRTRRKIVPVVSTLKLKAAAVTKPTKSIARARAVRPVPTAVADAVLPSKSNKRKAKQGSPSPSPSDSETSPRPQKIMKILSSDHQERHEHQEHQEQEQVHEQEQALTPANRPKRNIVRPGRYSK
ncbi:hypothetical protein BGX33_006350 [Mortierella sp. NVP41]|nr:hypothetical protein BGX33_006350 [Mortierella sp. NVP41]